MEFASSTNLQEIKSVSIIYDGITGSTTARIETTYQIAFFLWFVFAIVIMFICQIIIRHFNKRIKKDNY